MNRKGSFNNFSRSLTAAVIVFAAAVGGCAPRVAHEEERGGGVGSRSRSPWAIPLGLGAVTVGVGALLGGSKDQEQTQQPQSEQNQEEKERQAKEAEQAKDQKQY